MLGSRQSLLASGVLTAAASAWSTALALVTVPMMLHGLGTDGYGLYSVAFSVAALGSYLDLGLGWTTAKFVAEADADDRIRLGSVLAASVVYHALFGLIFAVAIIATAPWIARHGLRVSQAHMTMTVTLLRLTAVSFAAYNLLGVFVSALRGMRRFTAATLIATGTNTVASAGAALMAVLGRGPVGAALAQFTAVAIGAAIGGVICFPLFRHARPGAALRQELRAMVGFSMWSYGTRLIQMVMQQLDKLLIARWLGPAALTFYAVPSNLAQRVGVLAGPAVTAVYPVAAAGQRDRDRFLRQYLNASRLLHMTTAALALTVLVWGDRLLAAWVGEEMAARGTTALRVLTIGFWLVSVGSFDGGCLEGWNRPRTTFLLAAAGMIIGVPLALLTWALTGTSAVPIAVAVSSYFMTSGIGQMVAWYRVARYPLAPVLRGVGLPVIESAVLAIVLSWVLHPVIHGAPASIACFFGLIAVLGLYGFWRTMRGPEVRMLASRVLAGARAA